MQAILIFVGVFLAFVYATIIFLIIKNWDKIPERSIPGIWEPTVFLSVIIPGRNESENIFNCLQSVLKQDYPDKLFEIIFIDDHSEDGTLEIVQKLNNPKVRVFENTNGNGKKSALNFGINKAKGGFIITTDSDCLAGKNWLRSIAFCFENNDVDFIAGPVNFHKEKNTFERFQSLDYIGMMGVTAAGIYSKKLSLANGANIAFRKSSFENLNGYEGIDKIASGDDMLLLEKFQAAYPNKIQFLKSTEATVFTKAKPTIKEFVNQRIRWAGKTEHYKNRTTVFVQTLVGAFSLYIFISLLTVPFFGIFGLKLFACLFLFKGAVDYFFLKKMTSFFKREDLMTYFFSSQLWHIAYIVLVGGGSIFWKKAEWKGRKV